MRRIGGSAPSSSDIDRLVGRIRQSGLPGFLAERCVGLLSGVRLEDLPIRRQREVYRLLQEVEALGNRYRNATVVGISEVMHSVRMVHTGASQARRQGDRRHLDIEASARMIEDRTSRVLSQLERASRVPAVAKSDSLDYLPHQIVMWPILV